MPNFQDISAFSDPNFDTKAWINLTLKNLESQEKKEVKHKQLFRLNILIRIL